VPGYSGVLPIVIARPLALLIFVTIIDFCYPDEGSR
jgi:hypothetical protein